MSAPERHASAVSDALERIELVEGSVQLLVARVEALEAAIFAVMRTPDRLPHAERPDARVRAPFSRVTGCCGRPVRCVLCMARRESLALVAGWELCDVCVTKLEAALGVGG